MRGAQFTTGDALPVFPLAQGSASATPVSLPRRTASLNPETPQDIEVMRNIRRESTGKWA